MSAGARRGTIGLMARRHQWLSRDARLLLPTTVLLAAGCPDRPHGASASGTETSVTSATSSMTTEVDPSTGSGQPTGSTGTVTPTTGGDCDGPGERCVGEQHQICLNGQWQDIPCNSGDGCDPQTGTCKGCDCTQSPECVDDNTIEKCACFTTEKIPCPQGQACDPDQNACLDQVCAPGEFVCAGDAQFQLCNTQGTSLGAPQPCPSGKLCDKDAGACNDACAVVAKRQSSTGCEFWAVDMANVPPRDAYVYAIAVSNPSALDPVTVDVFDSNKNGAEQKLLSGVIAPRQVKLFLVSGKSNNQQGFYPGDAGFLGPGIAKGRAFRVASDLPIVATQFNPLGGAQAFTTDASLLLPTHALGTAYYHLAWDEGLGGGSSLVVVATTNQTTVTITPTVDVAMGQNGLPPLKQGVPTAIPLNRYDYVQLSTNTGDLTGTHITSDQPIAVFGGHTCGQVPSKAIDFCDHLEEQIFPVDTWGTEYVALRSPKRGSEDMMWRVLARETGANVTFTPKPEGLDAAVKNIPPGGFLEFSAAGDFRVEADNPILVGGYLYGCGATGDMSCPGDPSMVLMVPVEQWLSDYVFLVDSSYTNDNAKLVRRSMNNNVEIGCLGAVPDDHWQPIPGTPYVSAVVNINPGEANCSPGTNTASTPETPFGIIVVGEAAGASYAYPGGMALKEIAPG